MEDRILKKIAESMGKGEKSALVMITEEKGSTPRKKGSIMAVWEDGSIEGTVGGGTVEYKVIEEARSCIKKEEDGEFKYDLAHDGDLSMECGGTVVLYVKVFIPRPKLLIAGAGHVGLEILNLGKLMNFHTVVFEDRKELTEEERLKNADEIILGDIGETLLKYPINNNTYIIIVTRGHSYDAEALKAVAESEASYIGMIGSRKKTEFVMKKLIDEGISREALKRVFAPVGINIASEQPKEIALSIMSEILLVKNKGTLQNLRDIKKVNF
ncbi:XdhC family protein [Clostridium polynesiense]|uniref:XdhC family protein n=1 Tax=Clostridium polynesiense TaxID=1325933 RepID=UPI00058FF5CB|nr:XdhC/CoxI family protein [Clostridium polynesiense]